MCSFNFTDYFTSEKECINKYGNYLKYNYYIFVSYFIEEIGIMKNYVKYLLTTGTIRGKLNEYNVKSWMEDDLIPKKYNNLTNNHGTMFRLNLFNNETIHNNLNILFLNIVLPYLDKQRKIIFNNLSIDSYYFNIIFPACLYLFILLLVFFGYWFPIISHLIDKINKLKNVISIIPNDFRIYNYDINNTNY